MYVVDRCEGMMPNQAFGTLNGKPFYFRARHGMWALRETNALGDVLANGCHDSAGWWEPEEALLFVKKVLEQYGA